MKTATQPKSHHERQFIAKATVFSERHRHSHTHKLFLEVEANLSSWEIFREKSFYNIQLLDILDIFLGSSFPLSQVISENPDKERLRVNFVDKKKRPYRRKFSVAFQNVSSRQFALQLDLGRLWDIAGFSCAAAAMPWRPRRRHSGRRGPFLRSSQDCFMRCKPISAESFESKYNTHSSFLHIRFRFENIISERISLAR